MTQQDRQPGGVLRYSSPAPLRRLPGKDVRVSKAERPEDQPVVDRWFTPTEGPEPPPESADPWQRGKQRMAREIHRKRKI
jgi:hypothetical protein